MDTITHFHLRGLARHAKGLMKHLLGYTRPPTEEELAASTASWHQADPGHPIELCQCSCGVEAPPQDHSEDCVWAQSMCRTCIGSGHCTSCLGDGTRPPPAPSAEPQEWEHA